MGRKAADAQPTKKPTFKKPKTIGRENNDGGPEKKVGEKKESHKKKQPVLEGGPTSNLLQHVDYANDKDCLRGKH